MMPTFKQFKGSYREACHVLKARSSIVNGETVYGDASLLCQSATIAENESAIEKDLARTPYFSQQISLSQMKRQWLSEGKHYAFSQGNFSGENFTTLPVVAKAYETEDLHQKTGLSKVFSVAYLDETGRPSAFSVAVDLLDPTQFIVAHVYGTTESLDAREAVLIGRPDYFLKGKGEKTIRVGIQDAILTGIRDEALKERVADLFYFPVIGKSYVDPEKLAELSKWVGVNHNTDDWPKNVIKEQCDSLGNVIAKKTQGVSELSSPLLAKFDATNVSLLKAMEEILADLPSYTERESYFEKDKEALRSAIQRIEHFSDSNLQSIGWHELASKLEIILLRMTIPNDVVFKFYEHIKSIHEKILQLYYLKEPLEESKLLDLYHLFSRAVDRIILKESLLAPYNEILALQKKVISINSPKLKTSIKEQYYRIATCLMQYNDAQIREINVLIKETTELSNKIAVEKIIDALDGCEKTLEETVGEGSSLSGVIKKLTGELENKMTSGVSTDDIQEAESQVCLFKISIEAHDLIDSLNCLSRKLDLNLPSEVHINKEIIICKDKLFGSFGEKGLIVDKERFTELKQQTMLLKEKGVENLSLKGAQIRSGLKAIQDALIEAPYQALCRQSKTYDSWVKQLFQKTQPIYSKMWKWDNFTRGSVASFEAFYAELQLALDELNQTEALLNDRMLHAIKEESFSPLIKKLELMQASLSSYTVTKKEEATEIVRLNQEIEEKINALKKARSSSCSIESILTLYATSHNYFKTLFKENKVIKHIHNKNKKAYEAQVSLKIKSEKKLKKMGASYLETEKDVSVFKRRRKNLVSVMGFAALAVVGAALMATGVLALLGLITLCVSGFFFGGGLLRVYKKEKDLARDVKKHYEDKANLKDVCLEMVNLKYVPSFGLKDVEEEEGLNRAPLLDVSSIKPLKTPRIAEPSDLSPKKVKEASHEVPEGDANHFQTCAM